MPKVKICCINSLEEAEIAIAAGADAIGLVSEMPSGPGVITEEEIFQIASEVPKQVDTFLLTSLLSAEEIIAQYKRCQTTTIQLVDRINDGAHEQIKQALPHVTLVQVIHVSDENSIEEATAVSQKVDALLLDSGNPSLEVKELGGTGRTHDWSVSRKIVASVSVPVFLAGGLNPSNVKQAIHQVQPHGLDVCSGLRSQGSLDMEKVHAFFRQFS